MKTICLYFQIHQPFRLKRYRFFDIGNDHYYYDDYLNESIMRKVADRCYLPTNKIILDLIKKHPGKFKLAYSISGIALDQFEIYAPEVLDSFKELAKTGSVEFLAETYAHSLASLNNKEEFSKQVQKHHNRMIELFEYNPQVFRNTEMIYSDEIGATVAEMGYKAMLTEGAKHVLGWKSPNYLYVNALNPKLKILLKNFKLSDDIAFRFSNRSWNEFPLTTEKYVSWLKAIDKNEETINLFMDYETFGEHQWAETGIFEFLKAFPDTIFKYSKISFSTPSEIAENFQPVATVHVPNAISWADEERDLTAWLGNELQKQAFSKLLELYEKVKKVDDFKLRKDFQYFQCSDHLYYMSTKFFSDGEVHSYFNPFNSPYDAFINFMNILSDFEIRVNAALSGDINEELRRLSKMVEEKNELILKQEEEIRKYKKSSMPSTSIEELNIKTGTIHKKSVSYKKRTVEKKISKKTKKSSEKSASAREKTIKKKPVTQIKSKGTRSGKKF